jgi:hypothetical protein
MCVGVTVWFGWGGVVSLCRLKQSFFGLFLFNYSEKLVDLTKLGGHMLVTEAASPPKLETTPYNFVNLLFFFQF